MTQTETATASASATTSTARVAIVGATGYAGQELVRLLARHPRATLSIATGSQATSTPRRLPALARIWDGEVVPLDLDAVGRAADVVFLALPEAASAEVAPRLLAAGAQSRSICRARSACATTPRAPVAIRPRPSMPAGVVYGLTEFTAAAIPGASLVSCPGLLSHGLAAGAAAARRGRPAPCRRRRHRRRQVGRLGRRQGAVRAHALLREPRQRRRLRPVRPPPHAGDGAGARP